MAEAGSLLADLQRGLVRHLRDPEHQPAPGAFDPLRLDVYRNAVFHNVEEFIAYNFPIIKAILGEQHWEAMIRDFVVRHRCRTPLFAEVPVEFVAYLENEREDPADPPYLNELAHHEWSESELALDQRELDLAAIERDGDLMLGVPVLNPIHKQATYRFPVHRISVDFQPETAPDTPTYIMIYRNHLYETGFMELNPVTARLVQRLFEAPATGESLLRDIALELQHPDPDAVIAGGRQILEHMREKFIILGTARA
jgi:hypothetical protein